MFVVFMDCPRTVKIKVQECFFYIRGYWNRPLIREGCYAKFFKTPNCESVGLKISHHTVLLPCVHLCDIILCCNNNYAEPGFYCEGLGVGDENV